MSNRKLIALNTYIRKEEKCKLQHGKEEQAKPSQTQ